MSSTTFTHASFVPVIQISKMLRPWSVLDAVWTPLKGYHPEDFKFVSGVTPMSTLSSTVGMIVAYYLVIFGGREIMRSRPAYQLNTLFMAHNFLLTVVSGSLLALFAEQLIPTLWNHGLYDGICGGGGWTKPLVTLYYMNYITKYIELIDTVFLVLKKKPLTFLHCYHHPATALLCYTQLIGHTSVSWVPITLNLAVHCVMYWYYFQSARGVRVPWKEWITRFQIAQFIIDLGFVYFASWDYFTSTYFPYLPHVGTCAGEEFAAFAGCAILSSYLVLFIGFYIATYKKAANRASRKRRGSFVQKTALDVKVAASSIQATASEMDKPVVPNVSQMSEQTNRALHAVDDSLHHINFKAFPKNG